MKVSKGGFTWSDVLGLDVEDFSEALDAAVEIEKRITQAMK